MNDLLLNKIKKLTISALLADDILMGLLVLKGGNALGIAYDISGRGSLDIDFSMEGDFSAAEKVRIGNQVDYLLNDEFKKEGLRVFDVLFTERPETIGEEVKDWWGGYRIEFKVITERFFKTHYQDIDQLRRNAVALTERQKKVYSVDISKYEYIGKTQPKEIDGTSVRVYSPEMLALEKLRAICQQDPAYKKIVMSKGQRSRARDFYDIHALCRAFDLDFSTQENIELLRCIFDAKRVPIHFICQISSSFDLHREGWASVLQTLEAGEKQRDFQYYFDFVTDRFQFICT